jgi:putative spermidine/putrescine transport system permease protein
MAMAQAVPSDGVMRAADGTPLKIALARAERRERLKALGLVAPLFAFIILSFVIPILVMLYNSVYDPDEAENLPQTDQALEGWDGKDLPPEDVFAAFVTALKNPKTSTAIALIGKRLNYEISGIRSKVIATARKVRSLEQPPYKEAVIAIDPVWGQPETWATIKRSSSGYKPFYIL